MRYILLMTGTKAGVDTYRAWSKKDVDDHMAALINLNREAHSTVRQVRVVAVAVSHIQIAVIRSGHAEVGSITAWCARLLVR